MPRGGENRESLSDGYQVSSVRGESVVDVCHSALGLDHDSALCTHTSKSADPVLRVPITIKHKRPFLKAKGELYG